MKNTLNAILAIGIMLGLTGCMHLNETPTSNAIKIKIYKASENFPQGSGEMKDYACYTDGEAILLDKKGGLNPHLNGNWKRVYPREIRAGGTIKYLESNGETEAVLVFGEKVYNYTSTNYNFYSVDNYSYKITISTPREESGPDGPAPGPAPGGGGGGQGGSAG